MLPIPSSLNIGSEKILQKYCRWPFWISPRFSLCPKRFFFFKFKKLPSCSRVRGIHKNGLQSPTRTAMIPHEQVYSSTSDPRRKNAPPCTSVDQPFPLWGLYGAPLIAAPSNPENLRRPRCSWCTTSPFNFFFLIFSFNCFYENKWGESIGSKRLHNLQYK